jgi:hypothetical protein
MDAQDTLRWQLHSTHPLFATKNRLAFARQSAQHRAEAQPAIADLSDCPIHFSRADRTAASPIFEEAFSIKRLSTRATVSLCSKDIRIIFSLLPRPSPILNKDNATSNPAGSPFASEQTSESAMPKFSLAPGEMQ